MEDEMEKSLENEMETGIIWLRLVNGALWGIGTTIMTRSFIRGSPLVPFHFPWILHSGRNWNLRQETYVLVLVADSSELWVLGFMVLVRRTPHPVIVV